MNSINSGLGCDCDKYIEEGLAGILEGLGDCPSGWATVSTTSGTGCSALPGTAGIPFPTAPVSPPNGLPAVTPQGIAAAAALQAGLTNTSGLVATVLPVAAGPGNNVPPPGSGTQTGTGGSGIVSTVATTSSSGIMSWLGDEMISGIPNWALLAVGGLGLYMFGEKEL